MLPARMTANTSTTGYALRYGDGGSRDVQIAGAANTVRDVLKYYDAETVRC